MPRAGRIGTSGGSSALALLLLAGGCGGGSSPPPTSPPPPSQSPPPVGAIKRGPYLQHSDSGVAVAWYTPNPSEGRIRWLADDDSAGEATSPGVTTRHEAVIPSLRAGGRYSYRVYAGETLLASQAGAVDFSFRAPEADVLRLVVFGDSGLGSAGQYAVARAIEAEPTPPNLVMIVGDVIYPPADDASYEPRFFTPYLTLLPSIPFYAAPGNHDYEVQSGKPFFDVFTLPRNGPPGLVPESSYWLERAAVRMIVHDTNQSVATLRTQSVAWHNDIAHRPATFRLVFHHHVIYSSGPAYQQPSTEALRTLLAPVYSTSGIDVVFNGHDHLYERTSPIGGVVYVTTGAGGADLYQRAHWNSFSAAFVNDRHSYTWVEVRGRTLSLRQMDTQGRTVDALTISKPVAAADPLHAFAAAGSPPRGWDEPGFDDASWPEARRTGFASALRARRGFAVERPADVADAVLRVRGAGDFVVRLNGVEVGRSLGPGEPPSAFAVSPALLRPGANALAVEGSLQGSEDVPPSLELSLLRRAPAR